MLGPAAFANGNDYNRHGDRHYYRDGHWYRHDERGREISVPDIVLGAVAEALPPRHTTVVVRNTTYYYDNVHYYRPAPNGGYVVVEAPRR